MKENHINQKILEDIIRRQSHTNRDKVFEDFENGVLHLHSLSGIRKFKSIRRAIKRGHASIFGEVYPKRPFKNVKTKRGSVTWKRRRLYEQYKGANRKLC